MDIMTPRLEQQPSPAPWLVRRNRADLPRLIRTAREQNPNADQVVAQRERWDVQGVWDHRGYVAHKMEGIVRHSR
jgi:hypothetical protein